MGKRIIGVIVCVAIIMAGINIEVKASPTDSVPVYPYTVSGSSWIAQTSAGSSTSASPMSVVEVEGYYIYVEGYDTLSPAFHNWQKSSGGDFSVSVSFSVSSSYRSYSIHGTHRIPGRVPEAHTDDYYFP